MFIGHAAKSQAFAKKSRAELGFYYRADKKTCMKSLFFQEYAKHLDNCDKVGLGLGFDLGSRLGSRLGS